MKLGIFDSGIGGQAIADALQEKFPLAQITRVSDTKNVPYGDRTVDEVIHLTDIAIQPLLAAQCAIIIIACNTATALAISTLRATYPNQKFIGIEPMIKSAAKLTKTNVIAVCATPATLGSKRYQELITTYAKQCTIIEPDCSQWAYMIEHDKINGEHIKHRIVDSCQQGADVIVLGCTHYHWIKETIASIAGKNVTVLEPSEAIASRVATLLKA